ncbi:MAG: hypothetical protein WC969_11710 [Elusimicrobiota bacterium]|jgi:hypothetical protein
MKKLLPVSVFIFLFLTPPFSFSESVKSGISLDKKKWENVFVGHYGETLRFNFDYTAEAELHGEIEVVRFHQRNVDSENLLSPLIRVRPEEYVPENFTRMRLMQLMVIPKNVPGGIGSLAELKLAKDKELARSGVGYEVMTDDVIWPPDTFWVSISTPYQLFQRYTQSDRHIFILTVGENKQDIPLTRLAETASNSLCLYLRGFNRQLGDSHLVYRDPFVWMLMLLFYVPAGIFALLPGRRRWLQRLRLAGRSTLLFSSMLAFIGWVFILIGWRYKLDRWLNDGSAWMLSSLLMPWVCRAASIHLKGRRPWRVFFWTALPSLFAGVGALALMLDYAGGDMHLSGDVNFGFAMLLQMALGAACGLLLGLAHDPEREAPR